MHIFLDESGSFSPVANGAYSVSVVGALVVPDHKMDLLFNRYARLRLRLPKSKSGEVKGKQLNEEEVAAVCDLLRKNGCLFEAVGIDLGFESREGIERHQRTQAESITQHLTDEHQPGLVEGVWAWRRTLEVMSLPLYVQSTATFQVLTRVLVHAPAYYAQRWPKELSDFHWVIDGKEVGKVTTAEEWWSQTMLPMLQSQSKFTPMIELEGANYQHFDSKFLMETPEYLKQYGFEDATGVNLRRLMRDSFRFSSAPEPGLELVDVVTNATRRALQGNLGNAGWSRVPRLMIHRKGQYLGLVNLTERSSPFPKPPYSKVVAVGFAKGGRSMLTRSMLAES